MMQQAWSRTEEVPYCFSRSYVKFQGHTALKIVEFYPNWLFPDCNSSLKSPMAKKCCTKLEVAWKRCPIVFQGHTSNFKVARLEKSLNFSRSSIKFQGHTGQNITDFEPNWAFPDYRPVAAFKSLRFALFICRFLYFPSQEIWILLILAIDEQGIQGSCYTFLKWSPGTI